MKYFISLINAAILAVIFFMVFGCSSIQKRVAVDFRLENAPIRVAVLPFDLGPLDDNDQEIAIVFRKIFYNHFSYLGYIDQDIDSVDEILNKNMLTSTDDIYLLSHDYLGKILDVDALIYCNVRKISNLTAGIYAETSIEARLKMVDAHTGSNIWEADSKEVDINGIMSPSSLITLIQKQIDNFKREEALVKVAEKLLKKTVKTIPDPSTLIADNFRLPEIYFLKANINNKITDEGFIIEVHLSGEKGMEASFDIGDWKTGISMQEQSPGEYLGYYKVRKDDHFKKALIVGKLENRNGLIGKKIFENGIVSFSPTY